MNFTCPHCKQPCTITQDDISHAATWIQRKHKGKEFYALNTSLITCPNSKCGAVTAFGSLTSGVSVLVNSYSNVTLQGANPVAYQQIFPKVEPKMMDVPDYVPIAIKNDYIEAVRIQKLSPKASATLARRCIQGIIRDFWGIVKSRLIDEINYLSDKIDPITWEAIDSVRQIGNIGAQMEKDVNEIIDIEPEEAELLIKLIENLIEDWYIARHTREEHKKQIIEIAKTKKS